MLDLEVLINDLEKVNIDVISKKSIGKTSYELLELQKQQLKKGMRSDGSLQKNYSPASQAFFNKPNSPIQLLDTGEFYGSLKVDVGSENIEIFSEDDKHSLELRFSKPGADIFGLTENSNDNYIDKYLRPEMESEITDITGFKFE